MRITAILLVLGLSGLSACTDANDTGGPGATGDDVRTPARDEVAARAKPNAAAALTGGPGCVVTATPGCGGCACETCVCTADAFCCATAWDALCVSECQVDCGQSCTGALPPGCEEKVTPGCNGCACEACVCAADAFCCATAWDGLCVEECSGTCGMNCSATGPVCGDSVCQAGEEVSCPADCAQPQTKATLSGLVRDTAGQPIVGVAVSGGGVSATSGADGKFTLSIPAQGVTVVKLEKTGLAPAWHPLRPNGAESLTLVATMYAPTTATIDIGQAPATIQTPGGASVTVPQGSLRTAAGVVPTGPVQAQVTWVSPAQASQAAPVPLVGTDGTQTLPLETFGMVDVRFDWQGQPLQVAPGRTLRLDIPAEADDPATTGLFFADPVSGVWIQEGTATKVNGRWLAELPHLSWWNVDGFLKVPVDKQACVTFRALTPTGKPLPGVEIRSNWGPGGNFTIAGSTNSDGTLCSDQFPLGEILTIRYKVYLTSTASGLVEGQVTVTPTALKVKCGAPECQIVDLPVTCKTDSDCGPGIKCNNGDCGGGTGPCVPNCPAGQCTDDGCGKPCLACPKGQTCNPDTKQCATCVPDCTGQVCGSDGCNGSCGICAPGTSCNGLQCVVPCTFCPTGACDTYGFEDGLNGWDVSGDVAVIDKLGSTPAPVGGKMLRLSTGLAFAAPSLAQKAQCASPGVTKVSFQWRLYSEEFKEFCGSKFQDVFRVKAVVGGVETELLKVTIDELCPQGEKGCTTCGTKFVGLEESDIDFDKSDAWKIPWQTSVLPLPAGAATGTLVFEVADVGDSAFDTVVILDAIQLLP